jgi:hypothetical protein
MYICELLSNIYNYFNYSILKNKDNDLTENLLEQSNYSRHTMTLSNYIKNLKTKNHFYQFDEHV